MKQKAKKESVFKKLKPFMGNKKALLPISLFCSLISAISSIFPFYFVWKISKEVFVKGNNISTENVMHYAWMVVLFAFIGIILYYISLMLSHLLAFEVEIGLKKSGFEKTLNMPLGFFNEKSSGKIRKVINDGAAQTHVFLAHQLPDITGTIITPLMILVIFFAFDWRLGLAALIPVIFSFIVMSTMNNANGRKLQKKYFDSLEEMSSESVEYVRSIPVVKTFGQSVKSFTRFYDSINNYRDLVIMFNKLWKNPFSLYTILIESTAFFLIPASILLINSSGDTAAVISNFILYILVAPLLGMVMMKSMYFNQQKDIANQSIDRFNELFVYSEINYPKNSVGFDDQTIEFKNVSFSYDGKNDVLNNINFKVEKGKTLALVGQSGSGKTTIARLLARFWDVKEGEILIGGKNVKDYSKEDLMRNISFVFQNADLFKTSLRENISFGRDDISDDDIENALIKSRSKQIIDNLESGLDTVIGKKGTYLSGGEKQRIALARAFIKDAPIVLLDEATAFTDPENEHLIQDALKDLSKGKTTIMIAHRMTTVKDADNIAVVDEGEIVEMGSHEELMNENGIYKKMWDEYQSSITWNIKKGA